MREGADSVCGVDLGSQGSFLTVLAADGEPLATTYQSDGLISVDERAAPLRPAIIWMDRRAYGSCREVAERIAAPALEDLAC